MDINSNSRGVALEAAARVQPNGSMIVPGSQSRKRFEVTYRIRFSDDHARYVVMTSFTVHWLSTELSRWRRLPTNAVVGSSTPSIPASGPPIFYNVVKVGGDEEISMSCVCLACRTSAKPQGKVSLGLARLFFHVSNNDGRASSEELRH